MKTTKARIYREKKDSRIPVKKFTCRAGLWSRKGQAGLDFCQTREPGWTAPLKCPRVIPAISNPNIVKRLSIQYSNYKVKVIKIIGERVYPYKKQTHKKMPNSKILRTSISSNEKLQWNYLQNTPPSYTIKENLANIIKNGIKFPLSLNHQFLGKVIYTSWKFCINVHQ